MKSVIKRIKNICILCVLAVGLSCVIPLEVVAQEGKSQANPFNRAVPGSQLKTINPQSSVKDQKKRDKFKKGNKTSAATSSAPKYGYQIDLAYVKCRKIWYSAIGNHDLVIMDLTAYDSASGEAQTAVITFKCRNKQIKSLSLEHLFGPQALKGDVRVIGNFTVTHPQKFRNVRKAMQRYAKASGEAAKMIAAASGDPTAIMVSQVGSMDEINKIRGDVMTELLLIAGRIGCGGSNPLTWTKGIDVTLTKQLLKKYVNGEYKIWYTVQGRKAKTCWREIKYDVVTRITRPELKEPESNVAKTKGGLRTRLNRFNRPFEPGTGLGRPGGLGNSGQGENSGSTSEFENEFSAETDSSEPLDAPQETDRTGYSSDQGPLQGNTPWYQQ